MAAILKCVLASCGVASPARAAMQTRAARFQTASSTNSERQTQGPSTKVLGRSAAGLPSALAPPPLPPAGLEKGLSPLLAVWSPSHPLLSPSCLDLVSVLATSCLILPQPAHLAWARRLARAKACRLSALGFHPDRTQQPRTSSQLGLNGPFPEIRLRQSDDWRQERPTDVMPRAFFDPRGSAGTCVAAGSFW